MQPIKRHPSSTGFVSYVSEHRFGLIMMACALVFSVMIVVIYATVGFAPVWASHVGSASR